MPFDVALSQPSRFRIRASGKVTLHEIGEVYGTLLAHPGLSAGAEALVDCNDVDGVPDAAELRVAAHKLRPILEHGVGAIGIVARDPFVYGMSRMFAVFAEAVGARMSAFRDEGDAQAWLEEQRREASALGT